MVCVYLCVFVCVVFGKLNVCCFVLSVIYGVRCRVVCVYVCVLVCECFCCLLCLFVLFVMYCVMLYGLSFCVCCRCWFFFGLSVFVRFACDV